MTLAEKQELETIEKATENVWNIWLSSLEPWEFHYVMKFELQLHDDFMAGEIGWADLSEMLKDAHKEN